MSAPPTRCCAPATSGRCSNAPAPHGQSRYIGCVEIAACNQPKHQAALRSLPDFTRRDGVCGTDDCGKPTQQGICPEHRQLYQRHGVSIRALLATEPAPMTESAADVPDAVAPAPPTAPKESGSEGAPPDFLDEVIAASGPEFPAKVEEAQRRRSALNQAMPDPVPAAETPAAPQEAAVEGATLEPHPLETRRDALVARLLAAGFVESPGPSEHLRRFDGPNGAVLIPVGHPCEVEQDFANTLDHSEKECAKVEAAKARQGDVVEPTAPGPTVAELETQLAAERARADLLDDAAMLQRERADAAQAELAAIAALLDADPERSPAWDANDKPIPLVRRVEVALMPDGVGKSELERRYDGLAEKAELLRRIIDETEWIVHHCGSYGATASLADRLFRLLAPEQQRAILELQRAEAAADVARLKARFLNPPPPEKLSEYQRKLDIVEAKLCSLDHSPDAGKMVD